jgi:hypothetical protein
VSLTVPISLESLLRDSAIDAELGALASILVEARVPVIVAGDIDTSIRARVLDALLGALPDDVRRIELAGPTEDFAWLPEAEALGWRSDGPTPGRPAIEPVTAESTVMLAGDLAREAAGTTWAGVVRIAVRAVSLGYGLAGTIAAPSLEAVLGMLRAAPMRLTEDELSRLGLVVIVEPQADGPERLPRVVAAHYLRPVAVLATWDERAGRFEHFGWGVTPELAMRSGRHAGDFEIELERRREALERAAT